jgi:hypothetical protein
MIRRDVKGELEGVEREMFVAYFRALSKHIHTNSRIASKNLREYCWPPNPDHPKPSEQKATCMTAMCVFLDASLDMFVYVYYIVIFPSK